VPYPHLEKTAIKVEDYSRPSPARWAPPPGQVTAGLSTAQLLPIVPGALVGIPMGILFFLPFTGAGTVHPPVSSLFAAALAAVLATALLTALPARIAAHRSVAQPLSAEAT
jgi:putative ABC transport system permease protein